MQDNKEKGYQHVGDTNVTKNEKGIVDFPFDLNNLFSMQYSFDQLKMAIEYLANQQGNHQTLINELMAREPEKVVTEKYLDPRPVSRSIGSQAIRALPRSFNNKDESKQAEQSPTRGEEEK